MRWGFDPPVSDAEMKIEGIRAAFERRPDDEIVTSTEVFNRREERMASLAETAIPTLLAEVDALRNRFNEVRDRAEIVGRMHRHELQNAAGQKRDVEDG